MIAARALLRRYPALRATWPVKQARAWRERRSWRAQPRRMASWFRDMPDMRTRACISNLELPEAHQLCQPTNVVLRLFDPEGQPLASRRLHLARNASLVVELRDLLPSTLRGRLPSGQVQIDFEGPELGSSRAYLHWYNDNSLTSSHEKFGLTIPAVGGYWTVPNVQDSDDYRVHLAITNLDARPYVSSMVLQDAEGHSRETHLELPVNGSRFVALPDLFPDPAAFLAGRPGILYFGNTQQPAMYYYFVHNQRRGTWRAQHL